MGTWFDEVWKPRELRSHLNDKTNYFRGLQHAAKIGDNYPARFEAILLGDGEKKVEIHPETRVPNAAVFRLNKEDHTLGNLIRDKLLRTPTILFSAYKVPHPLFPVIELRVQTDGTITPKEAFLNACKVLIGDLETVKQEFIKEWELQRIAKMAEGGEEDGRMDGVNGYGGGGYAPPVGAGYGYGGGYGQQGANGY